MTFTHHGAAIDGTGNQLSELYSAPYVELMEALFEWSEVTGYCPEHINITENDEKEPIAEFEITEGDFDDELNEVVCKDYKCVFTKEDFERWTANEYQDELLSIR